jgi:hypothetical protein
MKKPLRPQRDVHIKPSACTNCGKMLDGATAVKETDSKRARKVMPDPGSITICLACGHLMVFGDDLLLRDPTPEEIVQVAGDRRILAIQRARGIAEMKVKEFLDADEIAQAISRRRPAGNPGQREAEGLPPGVSGADRQRKDPGGSDDR